MTPFQIENALRVRVGKMIARGQKEDSDLLFDAANCIDDQARFAARLTNALIVILIIAFFGGILIGAQLT